jgi:hypothetical protein
MAIIGTERFDYNGFAQPVHSAIATIPSSSKAILVAYHRGFAGGSSGTLTSVSIGASSQSIDILGESATDGFVNLGLAGINNPLTGTQPLQFNVDQDIDRWNIVTIYFDEPLSFGAPTFTRFGTSATVSSEVGATVVATAGNTNCAAGSVTPGTDETEVAEYAGDAFGIRAAVLTEAGAASVTINPSTPGCSGDDFCLAISVKALPTSFPDLRIYLPSGSLRQGENYYRVGPGNGSIGRITFSKT